MPTQHFRTVDIPAGSVQRIRLWPAAAEQTAQRIYVWIDSTELLVWQATQVLSRVTSYFTQFQTGRDTSHETSHETSRSTTFVILAPYATAYITSYLTDNPNPGIPQFTTSHETTRITYPEDTRVTRYQTDYFTSYETRYQTRRLTSRVTTYNA